MHPEIHPNLLAIVLAVVASFVFGWIWHGPLFGKLWMKLMKIPSNKKMDSKMMMQSMIIGIIGTFLTSWVMYYDLNAWRPSTWHAGMDDTWCMYGYLTGFFMWIGFSVPNFLSSVAWEGRSWKMFTFNIVYTFINFQIIAAVLAYMSFMN